jgi:hypothetical protein
MKPHIVLDRVLFFTLMQRNSSFQVKKMFTHIEEFGGFGLLLGMWTTSLIKPGALSVARA